MQFIIDIDLRQGCFKTHRCTETRRVNVQTHALTGMARTQAHCDQAGAVTEHMIGRRRGGVAACLRQLECGEDFVERGDADVPVRLRGIGLRQYQ